MNKLNELQYPYYRYKERFQIFEDIHDLIMCHDLGIKNVLFIHQDVYNQSIRYRVDNMAEAIRETDEWNAIALSVSEIQYIYPYLYMIDLIILHRVYYDEIIDFVSKSKGKIPIIFDVDDYTFHNKCIRNAVRSTGTPYEMRKEMVEQYYKLEVLCDGISTSTLFLEDCIKKEFDKPVFYLPNFLSKTEQKIADIYFEQKINSNNSGLKPTMVTFVSGSTGHNKDFKLIRHDICKLLKSKDTIFKVVGYLRLPDSMKKYVENGQVLIKPFTDPCSLLLEIAESDVVVVPLQSNKFSKSRSEIKYFLAASVGTPIVASPTPVYNEIAGRGHMCKLCSGGKWLDVIRDTVSMQQNYNVSKRIREEAISIYGFSTQVKNFKNILDRMVNI